MPRFYRKVTKTAGVAPGTFGPVAEGDAGDLNIELFNYDKEGFEEKQLQSIEVAFPYQDKPGVTWLIIEGLQNLNLLQKVGDAFHIHPLVLEDIQNTAHRPKVEEYDDYLYMVIRMLGYDTGSRKVYSEQISMVQGKGYVILFKEQKGDVFNIIRTRIRNNESRLRSTGPDYLTYRLIDTIVDNYFVILEQIGEDIEETEVELMESPSESTLHEIHRLKRELLYLRKSIWPVREVIRSMLRDEVGKISENTRVYLRDVYDHNIQVVETIESFRDMVSGMLDIYLSSMSNKMNEVMKLLTIIATIFIPLTFIAGIYGMNFKDMPELEWSYGYAMVWGVMAAVGVTMAAFFKKNKWL